MNVASCFQPGIPTLAWIARIVPGSSLIVAHGAQVEHGPGFFVEGVWDGPFRASSLLKADHFFGSALVVHDETVTIVPSRASVDRVLVCKKEGALYASNSLPLLLAGTGNRLDPDHDYMPESYAILKGVDRYSPQFHLLSPSGAATECEQLYYTPVTIDANGHRSAEHQQEIPSFATFDEYQGYLRDVLGRIRDNATSSGRRLPMDLRTTISAGYDSTAVTALMAEVGASTSYTRRRSNSKLPAWLNRSAAIDDGSPVGRQLGYRVHFLEPPQLVGEDHELALLAATAAEPELAFHSLGKYRADTDPPVVLCTGYHGDKVWDPNTSGPYLEANLHRGDTSGLNLGEFRLRAGFINVAVPFIGATGVRDIVRIANSPEMAPWRLNNNYDRPIPRRILEEKGIRREMFGTRKKAVVQHYLYPWNKHLRQRYFRWLQANYQISRHQVYASMGWHQIRFLIRRLIQKASELLSVDLEDPVARTGLAGRLPHLLHQWAVAELTRRYSDVLNEGRGSGVLC